MRDIRGSRAPVLHRQRSICRQWCGGRQWRGGTRLLDAAQQAELHRALTHRRSCGACVTCVLRPGALVHSRAHVSSKHPKSSERLESLEVDPRGEGRLCVQELLAGHAVSQRKLKEVLGHTPLQVAMGAMVGVVSGVVYALNFGGGALVAA